MKATPRHALLFLLALTLIGPTQPLNLLGANVTGEAHAAGSTFRHARGAERAALRDSRRKESLPPNVPPRILMVGNSLTRGVNCMLKTLFKERGWKVAIKNRGPNAFTLRQHVGSIRTKKMILSDGYPLVILQEHLGIDASRYPDARELDELIVRSGAQTMFYMTWHTFDSPLADYDLLRGVPGGDTGYVPIAFELDAPVSPVGWAFRESISRGLGINLWKRGPHASVEGRYLAALVVYAAITRESPTTLTWSPGKRLESSQAAALRQVAADVVLTNPKVDWNITP